MGQKTIGHTFDEIIRTEERAREILGDPIPGTPEKTLDHIDDLFARYIAASPFVLLASTDGKGTIDVSPKGDPAGFVRVLDEKTLIFPERPGNRRLDTVLNLLRVPQIGLIFLVPQHRDTLRVSGRAQVVRDAKLQAEMAHAGKEPKVLIAVEVERAFMHCAKCMIRSKLWEPGAWAPIDGVPTIADAAIKQFNVKKEEHKVVHQIFRDDEKDNLY